MTQKVNGDGFEALAMQEAIEALGLVKAEALPDLLDALPRYLSDPRYALEWRKSGTQLTSAEKAQLGMSARAVMSKELLEQITHEGMREPTRAHEVTLQRASHSVSRYQGLEEAKLSIFQFIARRVCPYTAGCSEVDAWSDLDAFSPLPPIDCRDDVYRTCRSSFVFRRKGRA